MYWIIRGSVGIVSRDGESIHAELGPGAFFGEIGILFDCPRTASVQARDKCVLAVLTAGALNEVLPAYPIIEQAITDEAQERLSILKKNNNRLTVAHKKPFRKKKNNINPNNLEQGPSRSKITGGLNKYLEHAGVREILEEMPLFNKLPSTILHKLALAIEPKAYDPFEMIIRQDTSGRDIYIIIDGRVEVLDEPSQKVIARLSRGAYFGEMTFLSLSEKRTASVRTVTECVCLVVTEDTLVSLCQYYPEFQSHIEETANARIDKNQSQHIWQPDNNTAMSSNNYLSKRHSIVVSTGTSFPDQPHQESEPKEVSQGKQTDLDPFHVKKSKDNEDMEDQGDNENGVGLFSKSWNLSGSFGSPSHSELLRPVTHELGPHDSNTPPPSNYISSNSNSNSTPSETSSTPNDTVDSNKNPGEIDTLPQKRFQSSRRASKTFPLFPGVTETIPEGDETGAGVFFDKEPPTSTSGLLPSNSVIGIRRRHSHQGLLLHPRAKRVRQSSRRRSSLFNIGPFPDLIQVKIFQYLDVKPLMKMQRVCHHWRQMVQSSQQLLGDLDLEPYNATINDKTIVPITNFAGTRPKRVNISNCFHLTDEGFSYLVNGIGLAKINVFKMKSVWEVSAMAIMDLTVPSIGADLEEIDLSNCRKVSDATITRLIGWIVPPFGPDGQPSISPSPGTVIGCAKLRRISLSYCKHITDRSMYHMAMFASDRIEYLDLTRCTTITDHGFSFWALRSFSSLKHLCLADCTFLTDKSIMAIASTAKNLESLVLSFCCALTDVSVEVLALSCPSLITLDLSFCGSAVSDASLSTVALHLRALETLSIRGCIRVTRTGVNTLLMLLGSHELKMLDISQCRNAQEQIHTPVDAITGRPRVTIKQ